MIGMRTVEDNSFGIIPRQKKEEWMVLLILHQKGTHWAFPKGHGCPGETPLESACRELKEETGLDVERVLFEKPLKEQYYFHRKGERVCKTVLYYAAEVKGTLALQEEEIRDSKWVLLKEAAAHLTFAEARAMSAELNRILKH